MGDYRTTDPTERPVGELPSQQSYVGMTDLRTLKLASVSMTRTLFWGAAVLLGFLQAWSARMDMVNDTISYLDMGDYIIAGKWHLAINGVWNPLYSLLLGITLHSLRPSIYWEYPTVHFMLYVIFLLTALCFDFLLNELMDFNHERQPNASDAPDWAYLSIGYVVFLWFTLSWIRVSETNPDMIVAASFYLACGLMLRIRRKNATVWVYAGLGLALGLGYLTKSAMFLVSLMCLTAVFAIDLRCRRRLFGALTTTLVLAFVVSPFITMLSVSRSKLTFGESAIYNYLVHVENIPPSHWQGDNRVGDRLLHPTHQIVDQPATFEFGNFPGSYPNWYDPSYWYEGATTHVTLHGIGHAFSTNFLYLARHLLMAFDGGLIAALVVLILIGGRSLLFARELVEYSFLLVPSIATVILYCLVHVELRYVAPFVTVAILAVWFCVPVRANPSSRVFLPLAAVALIVLFFIPVGPDAIHKHFSSIRELLNPLAASPNRNEEVVRGLWNLGLRPGDHIASLERSNCAVRFNSCEGPATWARLGEFKIVAEVHYWFENPTTFMNNFWDTDAQTQQKVIHALAGTGARLVVTRHKPQGPDAAAWTEVGTTPYYARWLRL
jgi:hypothetical protein